ncbi:MAG: GH3 auxin-responsive promoter family protein [Acidobacteriota bacterium]
MTVLGSNLLWYLSCIPGSFAFRCACRNVSRTQALLLLNLLRANAGSDVGKRFQFDSIRSIEEYQDRVPLTQYEDYREDIGRIASGTARVLSQEPVMLLEPTSGSASASKLIPYTRGLKRQFQRAINPWIENLFRCQPSLLWGRAYWSVTPALRHENKTVGGLPIGFEDDSAYLGSRQQRRIGMLMAVPPGVKHVADMEAFRYLTLLFLLRCSDLALISVWNPTFLILLMEALRSQWRSLSEDISAGQVSLSTALPVEVEEILRELRPDPKRGREVSTLFSGGGDAGEIHKQLWPRLKVISCWADAHAAAFVPRLMRLFPQAQLQAKGLLATEGVVSFPIWLRELSEWRHVLAIRSHFFEFLPCDGSSAGDRDGRPKLAHELRIGNRYSVVLTTAGGLYRYRLDDVIEVNGRFGSCPLVKFVGRQNFVSDRFGEKVHQGHVSQTLRTALAETSLDPEFAMVAFDELLLPAAYALFVEAGGASEERLSILGDRIESALLENYHYRYCRRLGQLDGLKVFRVQRAGLQTYFSVCQGLGQRLGDIKPVALHLYGRWSQSFEGSWLARCPGSGGCRSDT